MYRKLLKCLICVMLILQVFQIPTTSNYWGKLDANNETLYAQENANEVSFELYDKVYVSPATGDKHIYAGTVIENRDRISILVDSGVYASFSSTYDDSKMYLSKLGVSGFDERAAYMRFRNKNPEHIRLPFTSDFNLVTSDNKLSSMIPEYNADWWLGDDPIDGTVKYVTKKNSFLGEGQKLSKADAFKKNNVVSCGTKTENLEPGTVLQTTVDFTDTETFYTKKIIKVSNIKADWQNFWKYSSVYNNGDCSGTPSTETFGKIQANQTPVFTWANNSGSLDSGWTTSLTSNRGYVWAAFSAMSVDDILNLKTGDTKTVKFTASQKLTRWKYYSGNANKCVQIAPVSQSVYPGDVTFTVALVSDEQMDTKTCTSFSSRGLKSVRELYTFDKSDILFKNINKRGELVVTGHLDKEFPTSDIFLDAESPAYLTIRDAEGVLTLPEAEDINTTTNTIKARPSEDYIVNIPLQLNWSGKVETQKITASAIINGEKKYGVIKKVEKDNDTIEIDLNDFSDDPESLDKINISLYLETSGDPGNNAVSAYTFMSDPLNVTIELKEPNPSQKISFIDGLITNASYGDEVTLTSQLTSSLAMQSDADIDYKIVSGNATIMKQSYDPVTGIASAKIKPTNGVGDVTVSINKAGNENVSAAKEQTYTFSLAKKNITITAESYERDVGDDEPSYTVKVGENDLITGDKLPPGIKATTAYTATDGKLKTLTSGTDITIEEDTSDEVQKFKDKYEITYVNGTLIVNAGDNWLDISPPPNSDGWNSSDVTVKPSTDARNDGYTKISLKGGEPAESITIDSDMKKDDLTFILHKDNGDTTNEITPTRDIRVDKTAPELTVKVEKISTTFFSRILFALSGQDVFYKDGFLVTITAIDDGSGIKDITSPDGTGTITENGNAKTLTFTVTNDFKGKITANAVNHAGLSTTATSEQIINEHDNSKIKIQTTNISGYLNAENVFEAQLDFDVSASHSGLKKVSYTVDDGEETTLKSYTSADAEDANLTLTDSLVIPLTDIIQNAAVDSDTLKIIIKVETNSGNILSKEVSVYYDIKASEISLLTVTNENTWAPSKKVDFSVNEEGSGIKSVTVTKPDGTLADINGELTQNNFDFTAYEAGTYTISVIDNADNESMKVTKTITKIDPDVPVIKDVTITPENTEWSKKKTITFHVTDIVDPDSGSGVDQDSIKVSADAGSEPEITCQGNNDDLTCTFEASSEDTYTIEAKDGAGNEAVKETVNVEKIDTTDLDITDIQNDGSSESDPWETKERIVTFKASVGTSGLKDVPVAALNGTAVMVTTEADGSYSFTATENGEYTITVESAAGQKKEVKGSISKIDKEAPLISDLKAEQSNDLTKPDSRVTVSFKAVDQPDTGASGIASVSYILGGTEVLLSEETEGYSFMTASSGDHTIKAVDTAGNESTETIHISLPVVTKQIENVTIYAGEALDVSLRTELQDTDAAGRSYEWFYIDEAGVFTSVKKGELPDTEAEQTIPFAYDLADGSQSGMYRCRITNGDGYYRWSNVFILTVITDPASGLVMIPSDIDMKKSAEGDQAEAEFEIGLVDGTASVTQPKHTFQIQASPNILLENPETNDSYVATLQKETLGVYEPYESGDLAELSYTGTLKQKVKLIMPIHQYHDPGTYRGILRFTIRYGEGGTTK